MKAVFGWPCFIEIVSQFCCSFATQVTQNIAQYATMKLMEIRAQVYGTSMWRADLEVSIESIFAVMEAILAIPKESWSF